MKRLKLCLLALIICFGLCGCGCSTVLSVQKRNEHERGIHHYDCRSTAVHAFGYVRKERAASRKDCPEHRTGLLPSPETETV